MPSNHIKFPLISLIFLFDMDQILLYKKPF